MGLLSYAGGLIGDIGGGLAGNRGDNEFRDVNSDNFNLPGYQQGYDQRGQLANQMSQQGSGFRDQQAGLMGQLQQRANGQGPSMADMQMQRGLQGALAQQQALAASGRGNPAMAARQASMQSGNIASQMAGQGAMARAAEQQGAQGMLGQMLQGARGQDINQQQVNNQGQLSALQQQLQLQQLQQNGRMGYEQQRGNRFNSLTQTPTPQEAGLGMLSSGAAAAFGAGG